jgi:OPT oligopeptide transporter protein
MATGARGWILWIALAIMCADSLVSLLPVIYEVVHKAFDKNAPLNDDFDHEHGHEIESEDRLVPRQWVASGVVASTLVGIFLVWVVFGAEGIKPWATFIGFGSLSPSGMRSSTDVALLLSYGRYTECVRVGSSNSHDLGITYILASVRALGETDLNPVSGLGKLSQLVFSVLQPGNVIANIVAGGVAEAGAQQ